MLPLTFPFEQIVTGGTGGIGGATAKFLVAQGAAVALFDVIPNEAGNTFAQGVSADGMAIYLKVDITDSEAVESAVGKVVEKYGLLKGCVHCAGIAVKRPWTNDIADSIPYFKKVRHRWIEDVRREKASSKF